LKGLFDVLGRVDARDFLLGRIKHVSELFFDEDPALLRDDVLGCCQSF
jgi:hypothetical protein